MGNSKTTITKVSIEKGQNGYTSEVHFDFYSERQFTKESNSIKIINSETYELAIKDIKANVKKFVSEHRAKDWLKRRRSVGWLRFGYDN